MGVVELINFIIMCLFFVCYSYQFFIFLSLCLENTGPTARLKYTVTPF